MKAVDGGELSGWGFVVATLISLAVILPVALLLGVAAGFVIHILIGGVFP